jgi:hypothetical protein
MKQSSVIILSVFLAVVLILSGCTETEYVTVTDTTTATTTQPAVTVMQTTTKTITDTAINSEVLLADEGDITIDGVGSFYYQRFAGEIDEVIAFHDITFTRCYVVENGTTLTENVTPVMYNISIEGEGGEAEILRFVGLPAKDAIHVNLTQYESPQAGVMMVTYDNVVYIYILVSTTG